MKLPAWIVVLTLFAQASIHAEVRLPAMISDHMVLQSNVGAPIWGWADPGEQVTATLASQSQTTTADTSGKWKMKFANLPAGGPHVLVIQGKNTLRVNDVLVGEVWLASGQSNMAMQVQKAKDFDHERATADFPTIRMFSAYAGIVTSPQDDCHGKWIVCNPETVGSFSATAYFFGRELHQKLKVPVGLINSSVGGTAIEAWTSWDAQKDKANFQTIFDRWDKLKTDWNPVEAKAKYVEQVAAWKAQAAQAKANNKPVPRQPSPAIDPRINVNHPANLFDGRIYPLIPYAIRGAIWYQGESNAANANIYGEQLATMITDWRSRWGYDFPFAWVQLPEFQAPQKAPSETTGWVLVREQMLKMLKLPGAGMAITLGLGEAGDIHPKNKQDVGRRLASWALAEVYGEKRITSSGPLPSKHEIVGSEIVVSFAHADGGMTANGGELKGFAIAGEDQQFVWANARIEGNKVVVSHPDIKQPVAVRYAWASNPIWSLQNGDGLPATPFRTDDWTK